MKIQDKFKVMAVGFLLFAVWVDASDIYDRGWANLPLSYQAGTAIGAGMFGAFLGWIVCLYYGDKTGAV